MATIYSGGDSFIGVGEEVTWGTPVARTNYRPVVRSALQRTLEKAERPNLSVGGVSNIATGDFQVRDLAGGQFEIEGTYNTMGMLLKHAMGQVVTTGAGPFTHTYSRIAPASWPAGLTIAENRGGVAREVYEGCRLREWEIACAIGDVMRFRPTWIGQTSDGRSDAQDAATFSTDSIVLHHHAGSLTYSTVTTRLLGLTGLRVDNGFDVRLLLGDLTTQQPIVRRRQMVRLEVEVEVDDSLHDLYLANTQADISFAFTSGAESFTINLSNAKIESLTDPVDSIDIVKQRVVFRGYGDGTTALTEQGLQIIVVNALASGTAN